MPRSRASRGRSKERFRRLWTCSTSGRVASSTCDSCALRRGELYVSAKDSNAQLLTISITGSPPCTRHRSVPCGADRSYSAATMNTSWRRESSRACLAAHSRRCVVIMKRVLVQPRELHPREHVVGINRDRLEVKITRALRLSPHHRQRAKIRIAPSESWIDLQRAPERGLGVIEPADLGETYTKVRLHVPVVRSKSQ